VHCTACCKQEGAARERWLRRDIEAPNLGSVKDFLRFYIATSQPQLTDKPTVDSINTVAEWFFATATSRVQIPFYQTKSQRM
jgi:hypothetical protein